MLRCLILFVTPALMNCKGDPESSCSGTVLRVPDGKGFTVPQLMAHASSMGMSQQEAETLIYLENISPQATVEGGSVICLDGKPD